MTTTPTPDAPDRGLGHIQRRALRLMQSHPFGITAPLLAQHLDVPDSAARRALRALAARGLAHSADPAHTRNRVWTAAQEAPK